ncbi:hypothetical protein ACF3DV_30400 [Chlorogloeopsis fritschii PCC 9212]|uniref:Uncharacterized protein n=1 Tax=Chlorogloeopsis fritschii PCC 6912 TaxID=211165 RepID=A0A433NMD2_CHLFR|nr:hypothetical protein [Chlorogloeopsis fritschii]RUR84211.1 hypothetical protein PCC6912_18050 [Chlorogloeopsis fritschii PCC 6912]
MVKIDEKQNTDNTSSRKHGILQSLWKAKVLVGIVVLAVGLRACYNHAQQPAPLGLVSTTEVVSNTEELIGKSVTIKSKPLQTVGLSSFTVSDRRFFRGEPIVVVNASGKAFDLPDDPNVAVQVTGEVRNLVIAEIEREFKLQLQDENYRDSINKPVIIARSITLAPTPAQIRANISTFSGKKLAVTGKVENIQSPVLFSLQENRLFGGQNLPILLNTPPKVAINKGQTIAVVGVVRPFVVAEIERDYKVTWDLQVKRQLEAQYNNSPVLIAQAIYPSGI